MEFPKKKIQLKNGRTAVFRSPAPEDAQEMLDFLKTAAGETEFLIRYPEECLEDVEIEKAFLSNINHSDTNIMILCEMDDRIVGNCHLSYRPRLKLRHRGEVAIALLRQYWHLGIGTAMFEEMSAQAKELGLEQLELTYIEGNHRARGLYEKMGFYEVARIPDANRLKDGSMRSDILMMKKL